jgi:hypothetical protein
MIQRRNGYTPNEIILLRKNIEFLQLAGKVPARAPIQKILHRVRRTSMGTVATAAYRE